MIRSTSIALTRRNRWALSFADLALLLLGFFVLLQASNGRQQEVVRGVAREFGAPAVHTDRFVSRTLFQPGEALLSVAGEAQMAKLGRQYKSGKAIVEIRSVGLDRASQRFDSWDLAAARVGAVARALSAQGIERSRIIIRGLDQQVESKVGQQLLIRVR